MEVNKIQSDVFYYISLPVSLSVKIPSNEASQAFVILCKSFSNTARTGYDYAGTQIMIWEEIGDTFISTTVPDYQARKADIMALVNRHDTLPSFTNQTVNATVGETVAITDN